MFIEVPFDGDHHHILGNSKHFNINEINALKTKNNHFGILHLNIESLNKHIDGLSKFIKFDEIKFSN